MIEGSGRADAGAFLARLVRLDPAAVVRLRPSRPPDGSTELWAMLPFRVLVMRRIAGPPDADRTVGAADLLAAVTAAPAPPSTAAPAPAPTAAPAPPSTAGTAPASTAGACATSGIGSGIADLPRRDAEWRWPLPSSRGTPIEAIPAAEIVRVAAAASRVLREAAEQGVAGRAVPERRVRDALLDHVAIVVTGTAAERVEVPQRLVQAVVRMGFVGAAAGIVAQSSRPAHEAVPEAVEESGPMTLGDNLVTVRLSPGWIGVDGSYGSAWYRPSSALRLS